MNTRFLHPKAATLGITAALLLAGCESNEPSPPRDVIVSVLVAEDAAVPGSVLTLGWRFELADHWHLYTNGRSDTGLPPEVELELPEGWEAGPLQWPIGCRFEAPGGILDHIYQDEVVLLQTVNVAADQVVDVSTTLTAKLTWLACRDICVPGDTTLTVTVPVRHAADPTADAVAVHAVWHALPRPSRANEIDSAWIGTVLHLGVANAERLEFHPAIDCGGLVDAGTDAAADTETLALRFLARDGRLGPARGALVAVSDNITRRLILDVPAIQFSTDPEGDLR